MNRASHTTKAALAAAVVIAGCGGGAMRVGARFSTDWTDDGGASIGRIWEQGRQHGIPATADVVIGVAGDADKLVGLPLGGGSKWTFAHPLDARPVVTGTW